MALEPVSSEIDTDFDPIVAVFDTKTMALRAVDELRAAHFEDIWLAIVRGDTDAGETSVSCEGGDDVLLHEALIERGTSDALARRFDGILPPCTAVMSLRGGPKNEHAIDIIELVGGHIEFV